MDRKDVIKELEKHLGHEVSDDFLNRSIDAYKSSHHGPAALGSMAVMGYFAPFKHVLDDELRIHHNCWPCDNAFHLAYFFRQKNELGDAIRECLFGTKEIKI